MLTATSHRAASGPPRAKRSMAACAPDSSLTTTTGFSPAIVRSSVAVARAWARSSQSTRPAASGTTARTLRRSASASRSSRGSSGVAGVDRGTEAARVVLRLELVGEGRDRLLVVDAPAQRGVEQPERERAAGAVRDRLPVAVDEVRHAPPLGVVGHERDGARVRAERRAGERQAPARPRRRRCATRSPNSPTRRRGGPRRARRTSGGPDDGRRDPAPPPPADTSRRRRRRRSASCRRRCASAGRGAARGRRRRPPTAPAARWWGRPRRPARTRRRGSPDRPRASCPPRASRRAGSRSRRAPRAARGRPPATARGTHAHAGRSPLARLQRGHSA